jgi:heptosyltransferase-1
MKRFLIVKTSSIGDVIQCFHLIPYLKKKFAGSQIDWVVEKGIAPLLRAHPDLRKIIEVDTKLWRKGIIKHKKPIGAFRRGLRQENYDALFDLQGNTKSAIITALARADKKVGYAWKSISEKPNFFVTNVHIPTNNEVSVRLRYSRLLLEFFGDDEMPETSDVELMLQKEEQNQLERNCQLGFQSPRIMVCFGSNWINKQLTDETLEELLKRIQEKASPTFFFVWGNKREKTRADQFKRIFSDSSVILGEMSLPLWQRFMARLDLVISMDSAALHLCATTKTPSFSLFGPSSEKAYKPNSPNHHAFQGNCPYGVKFEKRCPQLRTCKTGACLRKASAAQIFRQFEAFWNHVFQKDFVGNSADSDTSEL